MTHAYSESYLNNAKDRLSSFFDYAINDCKLNRIGSQHSSSIPATPNSLNEATPPMLQGCPVLSWPVRSSQRHTVQRSCQHQPTQRTAPLNIGPVGQLQSTNGLLAVVSRISLSAFRFPRSLGCIPFTTRWTLQVSSIPWRNSIKQRKAIPT